MPTLSTDAVTASRAPWSWLRPPLEDTPQPLQRERQPIHVEVQVVASLGYVPGDRLALLHQRRRGVAPVQIDGHHRRPPPGGHTVIACGISPSPFR